MFPKVNASQKVIFEKKKKTEIVEHGSSLLYMYMVFTDMSYYLSILVCFISLSPLKLH